MRTFLALIGVGFAIFNAILWFSTPAIRDAVDAYFGRLGAPGRPTIIYGVQELLVYFDPWLARVVFPIVFTFGFVLIPWLGKSRNLDTSHPSTSTAYAVVGSLFLFFLEAVWLFLIGVGICCRGPNWNFYWPHEQWDPSRVEALNLIDLSDYFWVHFFPITPPGNLDWFIRELPGLLLIGTYFLLGAALAYFLRRKRPGFWRLLASILLFQLALLVPIKLVARFLFNLKYFISLPEFALNL